MWCHTRLINIFNRIHVNLRNSNFQTAIAPLITVPFSHVRPVLLHLKGAFIWNQLVPSLQFPFKHLGSVASVKRVVCVFMPPCGPPPLLPHTHTHRSLYSSVIQVDSDWPSSFDWINHHFTFKLLTTQTPTQF